MRETNRPNELLIAQAYASLSSARRGKHGERIISLAQIGHYEICMVEMSPNGPVAAHLFWLELFDHAVGAAVDSCQCDTILEAAALFQELIGQVGTSNR